MLVVFSVFTFKTMTNMNMLRTSILLVLTCFPVLSVCAVKNVTVSKCCALDEYLSLEYKCEQSNLNSWSIKIYNQAKKSWINNNSLPANWVLKENNKPNCVKPIQISRGTNYIPFVNGSVFLLEYNRLLHPVDYCIDYRSGLFCLEETPASISTVRIKKCCGDGGIISSTNSTCIRFKDKAYNIDVGSDKTLTAGFPACKYHMGIAGKFNRSNLQINGSLWMPGTKKLLHVGNYCLEHVLESAGSPSVFICHEPDVSNVKVEPAESDLRFTLYPIGLALSVIFLAATLAAGSLLPASHHVLHWRCQTNHVACLLLGDVLLCITDLSGEMDYTPCFMIAVSMHFLFLAAFFWLNTMCFNIWWTFRDLRPQSTEKSQERLRLRLYEAYAWGVPFLIALTAAVLDSVSSSGYDFLRPKFGQKSCWFYGDMEILTFFFGPIGTLLFVNLALFAVTARELTCGLWKRELVKSTTERAALGRVCLKLVVVMGVTWIADVLSWAVGGPQELWYLTDLINCLQGVFIFIVVGCQPQVLAAVKRLWCLRKHRQNGIAGTTNHHSSSSQALPSMGDTVTNTHSITTKSVPLETSC